MTLIIAIHVICKSFHLYSWPILSAYDIYLIMVSEKKVSDIQVVFLLRKMEEMWACF